IKSPPARICLQPLPPPQTGPAGAGGAAGAGGGIVLADLKAAQPAAGIPLAVGPGVQGGAQAPQPGPATEAYLALGVAEEPVARFHMSGKTSRITLPSSGTNPAGGAAGAERINSFSPRNAAVYAVSEELTLAEMPISDPVQGKQIILDSAVAGIQVGQRLIV